MPDTQQMPDPILFGVIAVERGYLTAAQFETVLKRQNDFKDRGIPMVVGEIALEMGVINRTQCNEILKEQQARRKTTKERPAAAPQTGAEPTQLGRFTLKQRLGGVMGAVYRGIDTESSQVVAIKILPKGFALNQSSVGRFNREVLATSVLMHKNIVRLVDAGIEEGLFYMVTEFIEGQTLTDYLLKRMLLPEQDALWFTREIAQGLAHAHQHSIIHRDIKPDNVMISKLGEVKLADFGLAKFLQGEQQLTADGIAVGTPHYIAPEQARALPETDHRADIYSLGSTLFQLLTGRVPYEGDDGAEVMRRHVYDPLPDIRAIKPDLSDTTVAIVERMLAKSPDKRYQTASELVETISQVLGSFRPGLGGEDTRTRIMPRRKFTE